MKYFRQIINFCKENSVLSSRKLKFLGVPKKFDVYNPSGAFEFKGKEYIFGRVEKRKDWANSRIMLFRKEGFGWRRVRRFKPLKLEDPFISEISGEFVLGGVFVKKSSGKLDFKTVFYKGNSLFSLKKFAEGPWGMKDIRLIELSDGKIGVFTRPQEGKYRLGKVGFIILDSLNKLNESEINKAKLIKFPFKKGEWGGVNDVVLLSKTFLGVIGHVAYSKGKTKFYYPVSFKFNIKTRKISKLKVLFYRSDLPFDLPKNRFLYPVIFPGGIIRESGRNARLYVGLGDSKSYEVLIKNPF